MPVSEPEKNPDTTIRKKSNPLNNHNELCVMFHPHYTPPVINHMLKDDTISINIADIVHAIMVLPCQP